MVISVTITVTTAIPQSEVVDDSRISGDTSI
jgi:hypothetical protein